VLFLDDDDESVSMRADGAIRTSFNIIDEVSPWPRPKEPGALSRLARRLRLALRRRRRA
jgi:hypothetical protein